MKEAKRILEQKLEIYLEDKEHLEKRFSGAVEACESIGLRLSEMSEKIEHIEDAIKWLD